jgi:uncharacterized glyoxalase superfamily protein PhnB
MAATTLSIVLAVDDVRAASRFYQKLGFRETFTIPAQGDHLAHCELATATSTLMLGPPDLSHYDNDQRRGLIQRGPRGLGITLMLAVDDVESIADMVRRERLPILLDPVDEYYGDRVFFFLDPFGYEWKITQVVEEVSRQEVLARAARGDGVRKDPSRE